MENKDYLIITSPFIYYFSQIKIKVKKFKKKIIN